MIPFKKYSITFFYYLPHTKIRIVNTVDAWYNNLSDNINYVNEYSFLGLGEIRQEQIISIN